MKWELLGQLSLAWLSLLMLAYGFDAFTLVEAVTHWADMTVGAASFNYFLKAPK